MQKLCHSHLVILFASPWTVASTLALTLEEHHTYVNKAKKRSCQEICDRYLIRLFPHPNIKFGRAVYSTVSLLLRYLPG